MKIGPNTGLRSGYVKTKWQRVMNGTEKDNYEACDKCGGMGYLRSRLTNTTEECKKCQGWGMYKHD